MELQYTESVEYMDEMHNGEIYGEYEHQNEIQNVTLDGGIQNETQQHQLEETINDVEMIEDKLTENTLGKLKYQEAEAIFRAESKQIISTQASEKTTFSILGEQKSDLLQLINDQQKLIEELDIENESLDRRVQLSNSEITSFHQRLLDNEVIVNKLKDFVKSMKTNFENIEQRNQKYFEKAQELRKKTEDLQSSALSRIDRIKGDIQNIKKSTRNNSKKLEDENILLKLQIEERKEFLNNLFHQHEEIKSKSDYLLSLKERKTILEDNLKEKRSMLQKNKVDLLDHEADYKKTMDELNIQAEGKKTSSDNLQSKINDMNSKIEMHIKDNEKLKNDLDEKLKNCTSLKEKVSELSEYFKNESAKVDLAYEKFEELKNNHKSTVETLMKEECLLKNENQNLRKTLEAKILEYTDKLEEKNEIILTKIAIEEKMNRENQLVMSVKQLEEQILTKKQKTEILQAEIQKLMEDNTLQDIIKKKAYLISSQEYLSEKLDNLTTQLNGAKNSLKATQDRKSNFDFQLQERRKIFETLKKKLEEIENSNKSQPARPEPPTGILKTTLNSKQNPISPKKVKFVNVSSYESSSLSGEVVQEKTFDQLLENFQKFKKPVQSTKKRSLNLD